MFNRILQVLDAASTLAIALTALVSLWVARKLWKTSKDAADAAKVSAEAAKENAELAKATFEALHRPWVAVSEMRFAPATIASRHRIEVGVKNYGTMAAVGVTTRIEVWADSNHLLADGNEIGEMAPQALVGCFIEGEIMNRLRQTGPTAKLGVKVEIGYTGPHRSLVKHREYWAVTGQNFELRHSATEEPKV